MTESLSGKPFSRIQHRKLRNQCLIGHKPLDHILQSLSTHLHRVGNRTCRLLGKVGGPSVPELAQIVFCIVNGRCINSALQPVYSFGNSFVLVVGTAILKHVAGGAADGTVKRKSRVIEHSLSQLGLGLIVFHTGSNRLNHLLTALLFDNPRT